MGEGYEHRKVWVEKRSKLLANNYAASVAGVAIIENHSHILVKLDPNRRHNSNMFRALF
jgi:hypothetical protein